LIYFIFRDDTYVVSVVFAYLMIIEGLAAGVRILLEKGPSRHHISEDQQFQENTQKFIYYQKTKVARRRERKEQKVLTSSFDQGFTINTSKRVFRGIW
jgi:hypothetical protein